MRGLECSYYSSVLFVGYFLIGIVLLIVLDPLWCGESVGNRFHLLIFMTHPMQVIVSARSTRSCHLEEETLPCAGDFGSDHLLTASKPNNTSIVHKIDLVPPQDNQSKYPSIYRNIKKSFCKTRREGHDGNGLIAPCGSTATPLQLAWERPSVGFLDAHK